MKISKTNAMRLLDTNNINYEVLTYEVDPDNIDGISVATKMNEQLEKVYKTLVTRNNNNYYVFVIPVDKELDLKKCAKAVKEKSLEMLHVKDLLPTTGYIRGGCSPLGMKKVFPTIFYEDSQLYDYIIFSAGKLGLQIKLNINDIINLLNIKFEDIIK